MKRPYNARPAARTVKEKDERFLELVSKINKHGTGEKRVEDLLAFLRTNNTQKDLVMFRRRHAKE